MRTTLRKAARTVAVAGVCAGLALSGSAMAVAAPATGDGTQSNLLYSVDGGASWSDSVTAERGQQVLARLFYDTTKETTVSGASLTTQIPDGFTYVPGSTRNVLAPGSNVATGTVGSETKAAAVADSVWSGDQLQVSPSAGFNGESNASQSGILRNGVKRYLNLHECSYSAEPSANEQAYYDVRTVGSAEGRTSGTNVSNVGDTSAECGPGSAYYTGGSSALLSLDLLGNRYVNLHECVYVSTANPTNYFDARVVGAGGRSSGTNASNSADTAAECGPGSAYYTDVQPSSTALDLLGNRYLNLHECTYAAPGTPMYYDARLVGIGSRSSGTNASGTADSAGLCGPGGGAYVGTVRSALRPLDLLDTARGQGFIEFAFTSQVPEPAQCGETVTEPEVVSTRQGVLNGTGTGTPSSGAGITLAEYTDEGEPCPVAVELVDDSASTVVDGSATIDVTGNDTIPDGSTGFAVDPTSAQGGNVVDNGDGTVTYTPAAGFIGTDSFTYRVTGPDGVEHEATVTVTVTEDENGIPLLAPGAAAFAGLLGLGGLGFRRRKELQTA